jgi:hypothetical protein
MNDDLPRVYYPLSMLDELREQRRLDNDDLARAYDMGRDKERAAVVAWLRDGAGQTNVTQHDSYGHAFAHEIERGEHRREENE